MLSQTCPATLLGAEGGEAARSGGGAQKGVPSIGADSQTLGRTVGDTESNFLSCVPVTQLGLVS